MAKTKRYPKRQNRTRYTTAATSGNTPDILEVFWAFWRCSGGVLGTRLVFWKCSGGVLGTRRVFWRCSGGCSGCSEHAHIQGHVLDNKGAFWTARMCIGPGHTNMQEAGMGEQCARPSASTGEHMTRPAGARDRIG